MTWFVYIAEGKDCQLYCGITTNLERRIRQHNTSKRGSKWAKAHRPLVLVWCEEHDSRSSASKREYQIKKMNVAEKRQIIYGDEQEKITHKDPMIPKG